MNIKKIKTFSVACDKKDLKKVLQEIEFVQRYDNILEEQEKIIKSLKK